MTKPIKLSLQIYRENYSDASDGDDVGCAAVLTSSPYQLELTQLQMERLRLEEERYRHLQTLKDAEEARGPLPRWSVYTVLIPSYLVRRALRVRNCHFDIEISKKNRGETVQFWLITSDEVLE